MVTKNGAFYMNKALKKLSSNYPRERKHFIQWLCEQTVMAAQPCGWLVESEKDSFPDFTNALLKTYAEWLLDNYKKGSLAHTQASINHYYQEAGLPAPWLGRAFSRTASKYAEARLEMAIDNDEFENGQVPMGCRVPVPEDVIIWLLKFAEGLEDSDPRVARIGLMLIAFLFLLRASSIYFELGDVRFIKNGDGENTVLIVDSTCVKMLTKAKKHQMRCPAPDAKYGKDHPRNRIFKVVERALRLDNFYEIAAPDLASKAITKWMAEIIPSEISSLVKGEKITSHSWRKAGGSAMCSMQINLRTRIMPWGRWKCITSCEKYCLVGYLVTSFSGAVFDWYLPPLSTYKWTPPRKSGRSV